MKLLVIRHAIAMDRSQFQAEGGRNDDLRPLTVHGARRMKKNARGLKALVASPDILIVSPLVRAQETAEILRSQAWSDVPQLISESLRPERPPKEWDSWFVKHCRSGGQLDSEACCVAIVGHEPHLSNLISWYLFGESGAGIELKKGGACLLEIPGERSGRAKGRLCWLMTPSQLRAFV